MSTLPKEVSDYLVHFENKVNTELVKLFKSYVKVDGVLPSSQDVEKRWPDIAPEYMVDAVPLISDYPMVSIAWAGYLGMAVAHDWDDDWELLKGRPYKEFYGKQGFDDLDENVVEHILHLPLDSPQAADIEAMMRRLAQQALTLMRREKIEPQSRAAFYAYSRVLTIMFRLGASMELLRLGYVCQKVNMPLC